MAAMSEKQASYRHDLMTKALNEEADSYAGLAGPYRAHSLAKFALIAALPDPADSREASEQIDALKGSILTYAKAHQDWAQPILTKLGDAWGKDGAGCPEPTPSPIYGKAVHPDGRVEMVECGRKINAESLHRLLATLK